MRRFAPVQHAPFGRLLSCYTINQVGDFVGLVALALLVYGETRDPLATSALYLCAQFVPAFIAPALTARLDQEPPRRVLPVIFLGEAALFAALALLAGAHFALWAVLLLTAIDGVLNLTARGLVRGAINETLTPAGLLREGNALVNVAFSLATIGGTAIGGVLTGGFGARTALWADAVSFVVAAALLASADGLRLHHEGRQPLRERLRGGVSFVRGHRLVRALIGGEVLAVLLFTIVAPIEVVYARETLDTDAAGYGLLLATWGAGALLGSLAFAGLTSRSPIVLIAVSTALIGGGYLGMGLSRELAVACAFSVVGGAGNGVQWVAVMTATQEATPASLQARVAGLLESTTSGAMGAGFVLGGVLTALTAPDTAFVAAGAATLALAGAAAAILRASPPSAGRDAEADVEPVRVDGAERDRPTHVA